LSRNRKLKKYDKSLEDSNKSLEIAPNSAVALTCGSAYVFLRKYEEALSDINKSLEKKPDVTFALICRGNTYRMMGKI